MATDAFLAMTAAEIMENPEKPPHIAWMACHFSPYSTGISNLPRHLPEGSVLILNDLTPIHGHDPSRIARQLNECLERLRYSGLLLDFQRPDCTETARLVKYLVQAVQCPVVVSDVYAQDLNCPVFLAPVPPSAPLGEFLAPWMGREIWLEMGLDGEQITLTEDGAVVTPLPHFVPPDAGHFEEKLHCHYTIEVGEDARFTLWRTEEDLAALVEEAGAMGVKGLVGLYQELHKYLP